MTETGTYRILPSFTPPSHPAARSGPNLRPWILLGLVCVVGLAWLKSYVGLVLVDGNSMLPTFHSGDLLLIEKRSYRHRPPARDDVVVARFRSEYIVKRVVGLPGETVEVKAGGVFINGRETPESHAQHHGSLDVRPGILFPGRIALLGDNRTGVDCQLFYAVVPHEAVLGRVTGAFRWRGFDLRWWRT